jgi:MFS family permease
VNLFHRVPKTQTAEQIDKRNFLNVQIDAVGVGLASAAAPFLSVFLTRLGASSIEVGLLTTMPAVTGLLFAIPLGQLLQRKPNIVPWFSAARLLVLMSYALTGLITFFIPQIFLVKSVLFVWAAVTIPQTILSITFSVVMNAVAGPTRRYDLMSRRWSILGLTTSITVFLIGQLLDRIAFPLNYQIVFMGVSIGGIISYYFSSRIVLPEKAPVESKPAHGLKESVSNYMRLIKSEPPFISFMVKRFIFNTGISLAAPLFTLYFVREIKASDSWIANINTAQTAILIIGYIIWTRQSRKHGSRLVLLWTTMGLSLYPILTALTHHAWLITIYAGVSGIFQAGLNLVFFDELLKTVPVEYSATFVSFAQSMEYMASIVAPMLGSYMADTVGIGFGLIVAGSIRLLGFILFFIKKKQIEVLEIS